MLDYDTAKSNSKLWYSKTVNKNVKSAKMMEFIKTYDQYPHKFNFGHLFISLSNFSVPR